VWDRKTLDKVSTIRASNASQCEWSPDSRHLLSCTLHRRLKVDNGIRVWDYTGPLMQEINVPACYQVQWRPQAATIWPERTLNAPVSAPVLAIQPVKPTGVYRPPGARGGVPSTIFKDLDGEPGSSRAAVPGASAARAPVPVAKPNARNGRHATEPVAATPAPHAAPAPKYVSANEGAVEIEKKMKNLSKKLKKIAEIRAKQERGEALELTQLSSLANESAVLQEVGAVHADVLVPRCSCAASSCACCILLPSSPRPIPAAAAGSSKSSRLP
jgi:translation initiation factor 2A